MRATVATLSLALVFASSAPRAEALPIFSKLRAWIEVKAERNTQFNKAKADHAVFLNDNPQLKQLQKAKFQSRGGGILKTYGWGTYGLSLLNTVSGLLTNSPGLLLIGTAQAPIAGTFLWAADTQRKYARTETLQFAKSSMKSGSIKGLSAERLKRWQDAGLVDALK